MSSVKKFKIEAEIFLYDIGDIEVDEIVAKDQANRAFERASQYDSELLTSGNILNIEEVEQ